MGKERMMRVTKEEEWALHHARLSVHGPVLDIVEKWFTRNGWFWGRMEIAPPKGWEPLCKDTDLLIWLGGDGDTSALLLEQHCINCPVKDGCRAYKEA